MSIVRGASATFSTILRDDAGALANAAGAISLKLTGPDGASHTLSGGEIIHDSTGHYHADYRPLLRGLWHYEWIVEGTTVDQGSFPVEDEVSEPIDLTDLRILVPKARRALEGPFGPPSGKPALTDTQLYEMIADACAEVILATGKLFGHELLVKGRDPLAGFPTEWKTDEMLTEWEASFVSTQAALNYFYALFRDLKTSEKITTEGTEWEYTISANVMKGYLEALADQRDLALKGLVRIHPVLEVMVSPLRVRDRATVAVLEWWDTNSQGFSYGLPGGQEASVVPWFPEG